VNDWAKVSRRTSRYLMLAGVLYAIGCMGAVTPSDQLTVYEYVSDASLLLLVAISIGLTLWAAWRATSIPRLRAGLAVLGVGETIGLIGGARMTFREWIAFSRSFTGASLWFTAAAIVIGAGLWIAASSVPPAEKEWRSWAAGLTFAGFTYVMMVVSFLAPGPSMPFSIGPRDGGALMRLAVDSFFVLTPAVVACARQLFGKSAHRVRVWVAAAGGGLLFCMGDAANPLVDLGHGQIYPTLTWVFGIILFGIAASLVADFEPRPEADDAAGGLRGRAGTLVGADRSGAAGEQPA
jgi:hypothetical protein